MNILAKFWHYFLRWVVALLAVGNLILLFVFNYELPGFLQLPFLASTSAVGQTGTESPDLEATSDSTEEADALDSETVSDQSIQLNVPSRALSYDGTGTLNLMDGVSVTDASGAEQTDINVFSVIKAGSSLKEKTIEYSATDEEGNRLTAERGLTLGDSYTGPVIEVLGAMPEIPEEELSAVLSRLIAEQLIQANDGFGKDITSAVTASVKSRPDTSGEAIVTLAITNMVNDSYSVDVMVPTRLSGPVVRLTTDTVTLSVGEPFNFYNYIDSAQDEEGNDLFQRIRMRGVVDTSTPGEYVLEFYCTDLDGTESPVETLTVTVE